MKSLTEIKSLTTEIKSILLARHLQLFTHNSNNLPSWMNYPSQFLVGGGLYGKGWGQGQIRGSQQ